MTIDEIRQNWVSKNNDSEAVIAMWDSQADAQCFNQLPSFEDNQFLQLLKSKGLLNSTHDVLDVGCGAAAYSIAIANSVRTVTGVDISSKMIENGKRRAEELIQNNVTLYNADWNEFSLEGNGFTSRFDLVFAHMTPAISNAAALEKMIAASKRYCILCKPTRRKDSVYSEVEKLIGLEQGISAANDGIINTFAMLWQLGYSPEFTYEKQVWNSDRTYEQACQFYINRAKQHKALTDVDMENVKNYIRSLEKNGNISESTTTLVTTVFWEK